MKRVLILMMIFGEAIASADPAFPIRGGGGGSSDLSLATGVLPVANGGTGGQAPIFWLPCSGNNFFTYGDSIMAGTAVTAGRDIASVNSNLLNCPVTNKAKSGAQILDVGAQATLQQSYGRSMHMLFVGTNDQRTYLTDVDKQTVFQEAYRAALIWYAFPYKFKSLGTNTGATNPYVPTFSGTWVNTVAWANVPVADTAGTDVGKNTVTAGTQTTTCPAWGTVVYLLVLTQYNVVAKTSTYTVTVDGVSQGSFFTKPVNNANITTVNTLAYGWRAHRFGGLAAGAHSIVMSGTASASNPVYFEYCQGNATAAGSYPSYAMPRVIVGHIPYQRVDYPFGGSNANTNTMNAIIDAEVAQLNTDGANIKVISTESTAFSNLSSDGLHPNDTGEEQIAEVFFNAAVQP